MLQESPSDVSKELLLLPSPFPATHPPSAPISLCASDTGSCPGWLGLTHHLSQILRHKD